MVWYEGDIKGSRERVFRSLATHGYGKKSGFDQEVFRVSFKGVEMAGYLCCFIPQSLHHPPTSNYKNRKTPLLALLSRAKSIIGDSNDNDNTDIDAPHP